MLVALLRVTFSNMINRYITSSWNCLNNYDYPPDVFNTFNLYPDFNLDPDWPRLTTIDCDWPLLTSIDHDWPWLTTIDQDWSRLAPLTRLTLIDPIDPNWPKLIPIDPDWPWLTLIDLQGKGSQNFGYLFWGVIGDVWRWLYRHMWWTFLAHVDWGMSDTIKLVQTWLIVVWLWQLEKK